MVTCEACGCSDGLLFRNGVMECRTCYLAWFKMRGLSYVGGIKNIRRSLGLSLRDSKTLMDSIPRPLLPTFLTRLPELTTPPIVMIDGKQYRRDDDFGRLK